MIRFDRLIISAVALLGVASCASTQSPAAAPAPVTHLTAEQIAEAQRAGYRVVVTKSGTTLFCQGQTKTGSHVGKEQCHTAEEWNDIHTRDNNEARNSMKEGAPVKLPTTN